MEFLIVFWLLCGIVAGMIGSQKGEGFGGFMLGVLFGPFGILFALFMRGQQRICPYCAELVKPNARICKHCGHCVLEISCPHCKKRLLHVPERAGMEASCPHCRGVFTFPVT